MPDFSSNVQVTPYTFTISRNSTQYIVQNNITGEITYYTISGGDFATVLEYAIGNIVNVVQGADSVFIGAILIKSGLYVVKSQIDFLLSVATKDGIVIDGEGFGTCLSLEPGSALDSGFRINITAFKIRHMRIKSDQYVTNLARVDGNHTLSGGSSSRRTDFGMFYDVMFEGPTGNAGMYNNTAIVTGQRGILLNGTSIAVFFTHIQNCKFLGLDVGIFCYEANCTSTQQFGNIFMACETAVKISDGSGQHNISNCWIQGDTAVGTTGIDISGTGKNTNINNIISELHRENPPSTAVDCRTILLNTGVQNTRIGSSISNVWDNGTTRKTVVDNSGSVDNDNIFDERIVARGQHYFSMEDNIVKTNSAVFWNNFSGKQRFYDASFDHYWSIGNTAELTSDRLVSFPEMLANGEFLETGGKLKTGYLLVNTTPVTLVVAGPSMIKVDASGGARTVNLPAASGNAGLFYTVIKSDSSSNNVTVDANSSETINGALTFVLTEQYQSVVLRCDGANWLTQPNSSERTGKAVASGNGSTTLFNIAHGLGVTPSNAMISVAKPSTGRTYTVDATNIAVTFDSAPANASNNVEIHWRVVI